MRKDVEISPEVDGSRIAGDVRFFPGCRVAGSRSLIGPGCVLGEEGPVVLDNCRIGRNVELKGGFFKDAVFLDGVSIGSGAHVRGGTIIEEQARAAHAVGLKQTILMPFTAAGSLVNFCDVLMAGGTSRENHSEIGSSYVHFNYTPNQDKATASLIGDVPRGVFLQEAPVFLGGQGGLVGPARIAYGSVIGAGAICREDIPEERQLFIPATPYEGKRYFASGVYRNIARTAANNLSYLGSIAALYAWYAAVRVRFVRDGFEEALLIGAKEALECVFDERVSRLTDLAERLSGSIKWLEGHAGEDGEIEAQRAFQRAWIGAVSRVELQTPSPPTPLPGALDDSKDYLDAIQSIDAGARSEGVAWLESIVKGFEDIWSTGNE